MAFTCRNRININVVAGGEEVELEVVAAAVKSSPLCLREWMCVSVFAYISKTLAHTELYRYPHIQTYSTLAFQSDSTLLQQMLTFLGND